MTMELRIFANVALGAGPQRPRGVRPVAQHAQRSVAVPMADPIESELTRIIEAAPASGESVQQAFNAKEHALRLWFETLTSTECARLYAVLSSDEPITAFRRLSAERRSRVLESLAATARRRSR